MIRNILIGAKKSVPGLFADTHTHREGRKVLVFRCPWSGIKEPARGSDFHNVRTIYLLRTSCNVYTGPCSDMTIQDLGLLMPHSCLHTIRMLPQRMREMELPFRNAGVLIVMVHFPDYKKRARGSVVPSSLKVCPMRQCHQRVARPPVGFSEWRRNGRLEIVMVTSVHDSGHAVFPHRHYTSNRPSSSSRVCVYLCRRTVN